MPKVPAEVTKEQYLLRSTFFYNRLRSEGFFNLFMQVQKYLKAEGNRLEWTNRGEWGVSEDAWQLIQGTNIPVALLFMHPKVLTTSPEFLKYYRSVAMIPQKGLAAVSGVSSLEKIESGRSGVNKSQTERLVKTINEFTSLMVNLSTGLNKNELEGMMYATAGVKIDGSWRNQIGNEGERVIRTILFDGLVANDEVSSVTCRGNTQEVTPKTINRIREGLEEDQTLNLMNGYSVKYSSEPDVEMKDEKGDTVGVIEIKSGIDPAGALERLGAMLKSFENTLAEYPSAATILVASCITDEVQKRLNASMIVRSTYVTTNITSSASEKRKFVNKIRSLLKLC
ncbi:MAG: XcyI family restriction endonuclease [Bacteroidaceae bacterium]|nr:XcyI family restriction endonuclease [Bacteroidaceae bacterium]